MSVCKNSACDVCLSTFRSYPKRYNRVKCSVCEAHYCRGCFENGEECPNCGCSKYVISDIRDIPEPYRGRIKRVEEIEETKGYDASVINLYDDISQASSLLREASDMSNLVFQIRERESMLRARAEKLLSGSRRCGSQESPFIIPCPKCSESCLNSVYCCETCSYNIFDMTESEFDMVVSQLNNNFN